MTGSAPGKSEPSESSSAKGSLLARLVARWEKHPVRTVLLDVAVVSAAVAAVLVLWPAAGSQPDDQTNGEDAADSPGVHQSADAQHPLPDAVGGTPLGPGSCWQEAGGGALVSCDALHTHEVYAVGECDDAAFVQYLGGRPGMERLLVEPTTIRAGELEACAFRAPPGEQLVSSAKGVLLTDDHSAWRLCVDSRVGADVPCAEPHTGEDVAPDPSTEGADCSAAVQDYTGARLADLDGRLRVVSIHTDGGLRCRVETTGADLLTGSLRNIGTGSIPFHQG